MANDGGGWTKILSYRTGSSSGWNSHADGGNAVSPANLLHGKVQDSSGFGKLSDATINALTTDSAPNTVYRFLDESAAFTGGVNFFVKSAQPWVNTANGMGLTNGASWDRTWAAPNSFDQSTTTWTTRQGAMTGWWSALDSEPPNDATRYYLDYNGWTQTTNRHFTSAGPTAGIRDYISGWVR